MTRYYAKHGGVSTASGDIEITRGDYLHAIDRMSNGERVTVIDGSLKVYEGPVHQIDEEGFYIGNSPELQEGAPLILDAPPTGLLKPRWVDNAWVEGASPEELFEIARLARLGDVDEYLNSEAKALGYDDIKSAVTYAPSTHPKFGPEGRAFLAWRDAVYDTCYALLDEVLAGTRPVPTAEELISLLPILTITYE